MYWGYWAFYSAKSESAYVDGLAYQDDGGEGSGLFTVPTGASYGRFTINTSNATTAWINTKNRQPTGKKLFRINPNYMPDAEKPVNPCDFNGCDISIFKKCLCVGDSLTQGVCNYKENGEIVANVAFPDYAYPAHLKKITGIEVTNMGLAGLTTAQWYSAKSSADLSGYDIAIIQLGVNDAIYNNGWSDEEGTALGNIITKLQTENKGIKIFVATIIPSLAYKGTKFNSVSSGIRTFVETLADSDVVLVDLAEYGHTGDYEAYNKGHLTAYGYLRLAEDYKAYISYIISTNKDDYRYVQFIGTDHEP